MRNFKWNQRLERLIKKSMQSIGTMNWESQYSRCFGDQHIILYNTCIIMKIAYWNCVHEQYGYKPWFKSCHIKIELSSVSSRLFVIQRQMLAGSVTIVIVCFEGYLPYLFRSPLFCQCFYQHYNFHFPPVLIAHLPGYPSMLMYVHLIKTTSQI